MSQYDSSKPHFKHFMNQRRESASIDLAHDAGKIDVKNFWTQLMTQPFRAFFALPAFEAFWRGGGASSRAADSA